MALTKEVTKLWPNKNDRNIFRVGVKLILKEDSVEVRSHEFRRDFKAGDNLDMIITDIVAEAQAYIDHYKSEYQIYIATGYDNAVATIDSALTL